MEKLSENKGKFYFLFKKKIFYSDTKYKYRLSLNGDTKVDSSFKKIDLFLDKDSYDEIISIFNPYSDYTYTKIEKSDIIIYDTCNKLNYIYYGCFFESISDKEISVRGDYMQIIEDPDLIKSNIRGYKLDRLIE